MSARPISEDDLHAFVDQALDAARAGEVAAYLASHPEVAARVAGYARQRQALRAALAPIAEEPVPPELNLAGMVERRRRPRVARWWAAAAAVLLLSTGGAGGWGLHETLRPVAQGISALAEEAADSYAVFAPDLARPVELRATEGSELVAWASARLNRRVVVPDLSAAGYRFMGGRLVPTPHGAAVLFLYDDDHGTRLALLTRAMEIERDTGMARHSRGRVTGFTWADKGIGYSLVGPAAPEALHPLADEVRRQVGGEA